MRDYFIQTFFRDSPSWHFFVVLSHVADLIKVLEAFGALTLDTLLFQLLGFLKDRYWRAHHVHASLLAPIFALFDFEDLDVIFFEGLHLVSFLELCVRADLGAILLVVDDVL